VDGGEWNQRRLSVSSDQQVRSNLGTRYDPKVLWEIVKRAAEASGINKLAPHDLRRTCACLCHVAGGELDQIRFLLGQVSIRRTEQYLGCKQKLRFAVNDKIGIKP
jgi:integrase